MALLAADKTQKDVDKERSTRRAQAKKNAAWSEKVEDREAREARRAKRGKKKEWLKKEAGPPAEVAGTLRASRVRTKDKGGGDGGAGEKTNEENGGDDGDDWEEMAREEKMAKKVRQGTMGKKAFDSMFQED